MPTVRTGPVIGLIAQIVLLAALTATVGVGVAGWLAGVAYGVVTCAALTRGLRRSGAAELGPADRVTLTRATLVGGVTALAVDSIFRPAPVLVLVALTVVALALDAVDGKVARSTGTATSLGARFDMEVDAFLILVLSGYAMRSVGAWALLIGAMRYGFVAAGWVLPWMRAALPPRYWRKVVAAAQGILLAVVAAGVLPASLAVIVLVAALATLVESFGRDVRWLWQHRVIEVGHRHRTIRVGTRYRQPEPSGAANRPPCVARPPLRHRTRSRRMARADDVAAVVRGARPERGLPDSPR